MMRTRKEVKRTSILTTLMRDMTGTAMQKLGLFVRLKAAGGFVCEDPAQLAVTERSLRLLAATEDQSG